MKSIVCFFPLCASCPIMEASYALSTKECLEEEVRRDLDAYRTTVWWIGKTALATFK